MRKITILAIVTIILVIVDIIFQYKSNINTRQLISDNNLDLLNLIEERYEVEVE